MYWVIQEDTQREPKFEELLQVLERYSLPHSIHKIIPLAEPGDLIEYRDATGKWVTTTRTMIPDITVDNPVIAMGSYSMRHIARIRGWTPGVFDLIEWGTEKQIAGWGSHMLNADARLFTFATVPSDMDEFFLRPEGDTKAFSGTLYTKEKFFEWQHKVVDLHEDDGRGLTPETAVVMAALKTIFREYRLWVVDGKIVTQSLYRIGTEHNGSSRIRYDPQVDENVLAYARERLEQWQPDVRAFVMDVAETPEGMRIIELNCLNASGYYAANMGKLVEALELMGY